MERTIIFCIIFVLCVVLAYIAGRLDGKTINNRKVAELKRALALAEYSQTKMSDCLRKANAELTNTHGQARGVV